MLNLEFVHYFACVVRAMTKCLILLSDVEWPSSVLFSVMYLPIFLASSVLNGCKIQGVCVVSENEGMLMFVVLFTPRSKWAPLKKGTSTGLC